MHCSNPCCIRLSARQAGKYIQCQHKHTESTVFLWKRSTKISVLTYRTLQTKASFLVPERWMTSGHRTKPIILNLLFQEHKNKVSVEVQETQAETMCDQDLKTLKKHYQVWASLIFLHIEQFLLSCPREVSFSSHFKHKPNCQLCWATASRVFFGPTEAILGSIRESPRTVFPRDQPFSFLLSSYYFCMGPTPKSAGASSLTG